MNRSWRQYPGQWCILVRKTQSIWGMWTHTAKIVRNAFGLSWLEHRLIPTSYIYSRWLFFIVRELKEPTGYLTDHTDIYAHLTSAHLHSSCYALFYIRPWYLCSLHCFSSHKEEEATLAFTDLCMPHFWTEYLVWFTLLVQLLRNIKKSDGITKPGVSTFVLFPLTGWVFISNFMITQKKRFAPSWTICKGSDVYELLLFSTD